MRAVLDVPCSVSTVARDRNAGQDVAAMRLHLALLLALVSCSSTSSDAQRQHASSKLVDCSVAAPFRDAFDADRARPKFVAILSPT